MPTAPARPAPTIAVGRDAPASEDEDEAAAADDEAASLFVVRGPVGLCVTTTSLEEETRVDELIDELRGIAVEKPPVPLGMAEPPWPMR